MRKVVITQSNYIPWKGYFDSIAVADDFVIYDDMQYTKRDWRNRNLIQTFSGTKWLTIPVEVKGKFFQKINETKVSDNNWNREHWNLIQQNYKKAPHFKEYKDFFEELYLNTKSIYLTEINIRFIKAICELLEINTKFHFSSDFVLEEDRTVRLVNICKKLDATDYYSGPAAKAYMDEAAFQKQNININYFDYSNYPEYNQLHEPFDHAVSILDLIFNEGTNAKSFLKYC
ncbi:WbqC family protein [Flavobacterium antarcticum]|uniref:WbqC family protein n=1 Tax=Flavobacterium antarcticum TaxID=271155 RepID=UPI0003B32CF1|nr:WbqC family protein [Flavobacterium antarcticum]